LDPLSDVLSLLKPRSYMSGGFDAGGDWSIQYPQHKGIKCYVVISGQCWLSVEGVPDPVRLYAIHTSRRLQPCLIAWNWVRPLSMTMGPGFP
jgi:hypothetical protein